MKVKQMIRRSYLVCLLLLALAASGCSPAMEDKTTYLMDMDPPVEVSEDVLKEVGSNIASMEKVAEDNSLALFINGKTAEFCVEDKRTGQRYFSNPVDWNKDTVASDVNKETLGSQITLDYLDSAGGGGSMTSFKDAFMNGQIDVRSIKNGVRVEYLLGTVSNKRVIFQAIRKEEFDKLLSTMPASTQKVIKGRYRLIDKEKASETVLNDVLRLYPNFKDYDAIYLLRTNLGKQALDNIEKSFQEAGCSFEDISKEHAVLGFKEDDTKNAAFLIPVEYKLENGTFVAEMMSQEVKYTKGYHLTRVNLLPYFAAAGSKDTGYFVVPDGSGALININRGTEEGVIYSQKVYGEDPAISPKNKAQYGYQAYMPVFGLKTQDASVLGIIENGEAAADVSAYISGIYSSYNNIHASFWAKSLDYLSFNNLKQAEGTYIAPLKTSKQNFRVRYLLMEKGTDYVAMAKAYGSYLKEKGDIRAIPDTEDVPLYMELVGALDKKETFLGVPMNTITPLTRYDQAIAMLDKMKKAGVPDIRARLTGFFNGGLNNQAYNGFKPLSDLGGMKGFKQLISYVKENNLLFYPDAELNFVYKDGALDNFHPQKDAARYINRQVAKIQNIDLSTGAISRKNPYAKYVVSPVKQQEYLEKCIEDAESLSISAFSLASIGENISSDFDEKALVDRALAFQLLKDGLDKNVYGKYQLLLDGCNAGLLKYAGGILNMPLDASGLILEDETIPFYQIAIHGYIPYAGEPVNMAKNFKKNILKSAETGAALYVKWMYEDSEAILGSNHTNLYSIGWDTWFDETVQLYKKYNDELGDTMTSEITGHRKIMQGVYETTFSNGKQVIVNYNKDAKSFDGVTVPAEDFILRGDLH